MSIRSRIPALALLVVAGGPPAALSAQAVPEAGAEAPAGCWYTASGCAARTARSSSRALTRPVAVSWEYALDDPNKGMFEGEPLVWSDTVVLIEARGADRWLHVVRGDTGRRRVSPKKIGSGVDAAPSMWADVVALRSGPKQIRIARLGWNTISYLATRRCDGVVSAPLLFRRELYYRVGDRLVRQDVHRSQPNWTVDGGLRLRGAPSLRGDSVYVMGYDDVGNGWLVAFRRADGTERARSPIGHHGGQVPAADDETRIQVGADVVVVRPELALPVRSESPFGLRSVNASRLRRFTRPSANGAPRLRLSDGVPAKIDTPVAFGADVWFALAEPNKDRQVWMRAEGKRRIALADRELHAEYLQVRTPPVLTRGTLYLGARAIDAEELRVLWLADVDDVRFVVPTGRALLVRSGDARVVALEERGGGGGGGGGGARAASIPDSGPRADDPGPGRDDRRVAGGTAVLRNGAVLRGELLVAPSGGLLEHREGKRGNVVPLDSVLFVESADGRPVHWSAPGDVPRALQVLEERVAAEEFAEVVKLAVQARDLALLDRVVQLARGLGVPEAALKTADRRLATWQRRAPRPLAKRVEAALAREASIETTARGRTWERVRAIVEDAPFPAVYATLRWFLSRSPDHAAAAKAVARLVPDGIDVPEPFVARDWLEFAKASREVDIEIVDLPADAVKRAAELTSEQRELAVLRDTWRQDLIGIRSQRLFVVSPVSAPGSLARCLSIGELVCDTLERLFRRGEAARVNDRRALRIVLFESRDEYLAQTERALAKRHGARGAKRVAQGHLDWTAGHYSSSESVSRMFLPAGDEAFAKVQSVFVHELTHHWIDERCPLFTTEQRREAQVKPPPRGYWIVEGFASMVDEFSIDPVTRTIDFGVARSEHLDVLAHVKTRQTLDWSQLFSVRGPVVQTRLDPKPGSLGLVQSKYWLGKRKQLSQMAMFYTQAAAACHYLFHADDGRYRAALLDYLAAYYRGDDGALDVEQVFGVDPTALGPRIIDWARERIGVGG